MAGAENKVCLGNAAKRTVLYNVTNLPNGEGVLSQGETAEAKKLLSSTKSCYRVPTQAFKMSQ